MWGSQPPRWAPSDLPCLVKMSLYRPYLRCIRVAFMVNSMQQKWRCMSSEIHHMRHCHSALFSWITSHVIRTLQCSHVGKAHMAIWGICNQHLFVAMRVRHLRNGCFNPSQKSNDSCLGQYHDCNLIKGPQSDHLAKPCSVSWPTETLRDNKYILLF